MEKKQVTQFLKGDQSLTHLRDTLGPALLSTSLAAHFPNEGSLFPEFLTAALTELEKETARPLEPYPDWTRPCPNLGQDHTGSQYYQSSRGSNPTKELQDFLANPNEESHDFRYAQSIRSTLEGIIKTCRLDLDFQTIKQGTPHTLRCTKNSNSHQRALKQRKADLTLLKKLQNLNS